MRSAELPASVRPSSTLSSRQEDALEERLGKLERNAQKSSRGGLIDQLGCTGHQASTPSSKGNTKINESHWTEATRWCSARGIKDLEEYRAGRRCPRKCSLDFYIRLFGRSATQHFGPTWFGDRRGKRNGTRGSASMPFHNKFNASKLSALDPISLHADKLLSQGERDYPNPYINLSVHRLFKRCKD